MNKHGHDRLKWQEILLGEVLLFGVLSQITQRDPKQEWLQKLIAEDVFADSPLEGDHPDLVDGLRRLHEWCQANTAGIPDEELAALRADFTRLFVGIGKPVSPPWESVYFNEDRMIFQEQTLQVREWYRRFGLEAEKLYHEPDDHVGLELSFLAYLAGLCLTALQDNNEAEFERALQAQCKFLYEHPLTWIPYWCGLVEKHARTDFYRGLASLVRGSLYTLAEHLDVKLPEVKVL